MGSTNPSEWTTQPPKAADHPMQLESWHCVDFNEPTIQRLSQSQQLARHEPADFAYSAVQHDFERRLSRFGITISETSNNTASNASDKPIPFLRPRAGAQVILDSYNRDAQPMHFFQPVDTSEDFPSRGAPTIACFTSNNKETKIEVVERQLRQAQTEAKIWKEKAETQERNLRAAYMETMDWRMKYEDLYSAITQDQEIQPQEWRKRHEGTKSLG